MIRRAEPHEMTTLAEIYHSSWCHAFSKHFPPENLAQVTLRDFEDRWRAYFLKKNVVSFVYEHEQNPIGFVVSNIEKNAASEILSIMVLPVAIRSGVGGKLMEKTLTYMQENDCNFATLWVVSENFDARRFYEHFGFHATEDKRFIQRYGIELCQLRYQKQIAGF